jgi:hypothetical protein
MCFSAVLFFFFQVNATANGDLTRLFIEQSWNYDTYFPWHYVRQRASSISID